KPGDSEYAIEMVGNTDLSLVQTSMVRYAESGEASRAQKLRDIEREEEWCQDHSKLRERLAQRGLDARFKLKLPTGAHPVKIVQKQKRPAATRITAARPAKLAEASSAK